MQSFPPNVLALAGFALAHAVWSVSDTAPDELLVPLALVEVGDQRQLMRFEADTQREAIAKGKATLMANSDRVDAWTFAREGSWRSSSTDQAAEDVVTVEFCGGAMPEPAFVLQRFVRAAAGAPFRLVGTPAFVVDGRIVEESDERVANEALSAGINAHPKAGEFWPA